MYNSPDSLFQIGETDDNGTTFDMVHTLPFSSDAFCQFYKVCKVTHLTLEQQKNHVHIYRVRYTPKKSDVKRTSIEVE